jgi:hypothetical protein
MTSPLKLTATSKRAENPRVGPIPVQLTLRNTSLSPAWVNRRMGVGYEDSLVREIYFTVYAADGTPLPVPNDARADAHRMPPQREDFALLESGAAATAVVDVALWYPFREGGLYRIVFTYENRWDGGEFGVEAVTGKVSAVPLSLTMK